MKGKKTLFQCLSRVPDPRVVGRTHHRLIDILVITVLAVLCGCDDWVEIEEYGLEKQDWLGTFLELPSGIPSHDTLGRVFALLDPHSFHEAFLEWVEQINELLPREVVSIDGKFLRGSLRQAGRPRSAMGLVSAWASEAGVCLGQRKTELKKEQGEKRATEELLNYLNLQNCIVTLDANGATTRICQKITEKKADYVIALKANQKHLLGHARRAFEKYPDQFEQYLTEEKNRGRYEKRTYQFLPLEGLELSVTRAWERRKKKWGSLTSFGRVLTERRTGPKLQNIQTEERYYLSSLAGGSVAEFAHAVRSHWRVENSLHYIMDVAFREDHCRAREGHAAENLALVRRMTLNMLKKDTQTKKSIKVKRLRCSLREEYAFQILTGRV